MRTRGAPSWYRRDARHKRFWPVRGEAETVAGRRVLIGSAPGNPTGVYAASVGPASEWHAINYTDSWVVTSANRNLQITNPNAAAISYTIFILGTSTAAGA